MNSFKKMPPEEAKIAHNSKKKKGLCLLFFLFFFLLGVYLIIFIIFLFNSITKAPTDFENFETSETSNVYKMTYNEATVGKYWKNDFSTIYTLLLGSVTSGPYTYYLGSGIGFPPMGLKLDPLSGVLSGTPKVADTSTFKVCVKDTAEKSACMKFSLVVNPVVTNTKKVSVPAPSWSCPAHSHESSSDSSKCLCDTGYETNSAVNGCVIASAPTPTPTPPPNNTAVVDNTCDSFAVSSCGNIIPSDGTTPNASFVGGPVFDYCSCPKGEHFTGQIIPIREDFWDQLPVGYHGNHTFKMCDCDGQ